VPRASRRELSSTALDRLLSRLDPHRETAGVKYEHLRRALLRFFRHHGETDPQLLADDTLDRLARRLEDGLTIEDVPTFAHGVARLVRLERRRAASASPIALDPAVCARLPAPADGADDALGRCFSACLDRLPDAERRLIVGYYTGAGREKVDGRVQLARELGLSQNALRHRIQRLRERLKACARACVEAGGRIAAGGYARPETAERDSTQQERRDA
jgi:DNA-directed RNA polymerase specialized sigma24 family protein